MIKKVIVLLVVLMCSSAMAQDKCGVKFNNQKTTIIFVNGIWNDANSVCASNDALIKALTQQNIDIAKVNTTYFHNPSSSKADDLHELRIQAAISSEAIASNTSGTSIDYYNQLGSIYNNLLLGGRPCTNFLFSRLGLTAKQENCDEVIKRTKLLADRLEGLAKTGAVVAVAHSQGNFYLEAAYSLLVAKNSQFLSNIRGVGVAAISYKPVSDRYITISQDNAIYYLQDPFNIENVANNKYHPAPFKHVGCLYGLACDDGNGKNERNLATATGTTSLSNILNGLGVPTSSEKALLHEFVEVYLNRLVIDANTGERLPKIIAGMVQDSINELSAVPTISTITFSNASPTTADAVTFSASASSDNGTITAYSWDFGDGTAKSTEASPTHTFTTAGTFTVTLTVTDSAGKQATRQKNIVVTGVAPNTFSVPATSYPGITFTNPISGQASCTFTATGTWIHDNITSIPSGPEGTGATANSTFPFSGGVTHSLIARRISNGAYLQVGASATVTLGAGEQLYFLINDTLGTYGDNSGSVNVGYSCSAISSAINQLNDTFSSNPLDTTKWNAISGAGGIQYSGTEVTFGGGSYATTQNKVTFSGSKIVVEGRFVGSANGRDTHMELIDIANGHFIQIGDTNYSDSFYLYGSGSSFNGIDSTTRILTSVAGSTSAYMDYRLTVDGNTAKIERSTSFADTTKTVTTKSVTLPISIVGRTFYLRIGTGALVNGYSPGTFDSVSVSVTQ